MRKVWLEATICLVLLATLMVPRPAPGQQLEWGSGDEQLLLPDERPLPPLPVRLEGVWAPDEVRVMPWKADLAVDGNTFAGRVSVGEYEHLAPLTVQGTRDGDVVEFSVRFNKNEVSYFSGHIAGTSVVGVIEAPGGKTIEWAGSWFGSSVVTDVAD